MNVKHFSLIVCMGLVLAEVICRADASAIKLGGPGEIVINLDGKCELKGSAGLLVLADGTTLCPLAQPGAQSREDQVHTACGIMDRLHVSNIGSAGIAVSMIWSLYRDKPVVEVELSVTNKSGRDVFLDRIVMLRGLPPKAGFGLEFPELSTCRFLEQPRYWPWVNDVQNFLGVVPLNGSATAYWSTVIGATGGPSLAIGLGEAAHGGAEITFSGRDGRVGLEISSQLRTDLKGRMLRLAPGATYVAHRMVMVLGSDPSATLDQYADFVCKRLNWHLRFPPYAGLFAAYGTDLQNGDPGKVPLSEQRLATLMEVVDKKLRPYGLDTIKTQFAGYSSSKPGDGPVKKLSATDVKDPVKVRELVSRIREKGFAPEDYDSRRDYPHDLAWHVGQLAAQGYRPALVCRGFYNIEAGTPELDKAAADLFEMTVKDWGYRYLMLDFNSEDYDSGNNDTLTVESGIYNRFKAIRDRVGPDVFIEACMVWPGPVLGVADGYRPGPDWRGGREEYMASLYACRYFYHGHFFQCDDEFFDPALHPFTWGSLGVENMLGSLDRLHLWISYNAMLGYSYLTGAALERVEPERWWAFQRGLPPQTGRAEPIDFFQNSPPRRWIRHCRTAAGTYDLIELFNWSKTDSTDGSIEPSDWGLRDKPYLFFDFWEGQVYGPASRLPNWLAPFSSRTLQVQPVPSQPALIGNSRHVTGQVGIDRWRWSPEKAELEGTFSGAPNSQERYWIWVPSNAGVTTCTGAVLEVIRPHLIRLTINFGDAGSQDWQIRLDEKAPIP